MLYIAIFLTVRSASVDEESESMKRAAIAAIVFMYFVGIGWAMGWNSIQYLINAEIFPLQVRSTGSSLLMTFHYANRYGLSKVCGDLLRLEWLTEQPWKIGRPINAARKCITTKGHFLVFLCDDFLWFVVDVVFAP